MPTLLDRFRVTRKFCLWGFEELLFVMLANAMTSDNLNNWGDPPALPGWRSSLTFKRVHQRNFQA